METNLHNYLQGIADAIKEKTGDTTINAQDFAEEIRSIEGGGEVQNTMGFTAEVYDTTKIEPNNIKTIRISEGITAVKSSMFSSCKKVTEVYISSSVQQIDAAVFSPAVLEKIEVNNDNATYDSRGNCNAIIKKSSLYNKTTLLQGCNNTVIPEDVEEIGYASIDGATLITSIVIPASVKKIGGYGIARCTGLTSITIEGSLDSIGNAGFFGNTKMKVYDFSKSTKVPSNGGSSTFASIPADCKIVVPDELLDDWKDESNWSNLAKYIISKTDYNKSL